MRQPTDGGARSDLLGIHLLHRVRARRRRDGVRSARHRVPTLDGITRRTVIELAKRRGVKVIERAILPEELAQAEEVFICGTAAEVTPVGEIGPHKYKVGAITRQMMEDYGNEVRRFPNAKTAAA